MLKPGALPYTITYSRLVVRCSYEFALVVRTSSHSLFVRVRALFVRVRVRCSRVVRTLFVRCSYAVRTSSHERELTRELRDAPVWLYMDMLVSMNVLKVF